MVTDALAPKGQGQRVIVIVTEEIKPILFVSYAQPVSLAAHTTFFVSLKSTKKI